MCVCVLAGMHIQPDRFMARQFVSETKTLDFMTLCPLYIYNLFEPPPKVSLMDSTRFFNQLKADQYRHLSRCNQAACTGNLGSLV